MVRIRTPEEAEQWRICRLKDLDGELGKLNAQLSAHNSDHISLSDEDLLALMMQQSFVLQNMQEVCYRIDPKRARKHFK